MPDKSEVRSIERDFDSLIENLQNSLRGDAAEFDRARAGAEEAKRLYREMKSRMELLQRANAREHASQLEAEKGARESLERYEALKLEHARTEDSVRSLNAALTYCENKAWESVVQVRELAARAPAATPAAAQRPGRTLRSRLAAYVNILRWFVKAVRDYARAPAQPYGPGRYSPRALMGVARRIMRRRREQGLQAAPAAAPESPHAHLEQLSFFARDAKKRISTLSVATSTSMAGSAFRAAHRARPDLIVYSITDWGFRRQRPQHLVSRLVARGSRAFVLSANTSGIGVAFPSDEQINQGMNVREMAPDIWEIVPCSFRPLNIYRDNLSDPRDVAVLRRSLEVVCERFSIGRHIALVQLPFWGPLAEALRGGKIVYDCMDNHRDFSTNSEGMLGQEDRLLAEADAVVVSSDYLDRAVAGKPRAKRLIRNGCEYEYFSKPPAAIDPAVAGLKGPVIGYYGAISDWFDTQLLETVARKRKDWHFILIGHTFGSDVERLKPLPNVMIVGEIAYDRLTAFLARFDVCMIPFKLTDLILATNPVKIYEYSAAGKPTVATRIPEVVKLGDLAQTIEGPAEFERAIEKCLKEPDKTGRAERLRAFARENDWNSRVDELETLIREHAYPLVSIVVLSFNNWNLTSECIRSILDETTYPNFELIVIDNASSVETRERLKSLEDRKDPRLILQCNETNLGYAGGNNQGCRMASGDILILLNNDTVCPPEWIDKLLAPFAQDPRIGLAAPMTNSAGNEQFLDVPCGDREHQRDWLERFYRFRRGLRHETDRLGFFCVAMRREAFLQIGELDAGFEIGYFEDDDYCARAVEAGWKLAVVEDAFVYHYGSAGFKTLESEELEAIRLGNRARFESKHGREWQPPIGELQYFAKGGPGFEDRPSVVIGPCADWLSTIGRPQQFAVALAELGCCVFYVTDNQEDDRYQGVRLLRRNLYLVENRPEWIAGITERPVSLFISFGPKAEAIAAKIGAARTLLDLSEEGVHLEGRWKGDEPEFPKAAKRAQCISISIDALAVRLPAELRDRACTIPQGFLPAQFQNEPPLFPPRELAGIVAAAQGPIVFCIGSLDVERDWEWLTGLAARRRDWAFVFMERGAASAKKDGPEFLNFRNVNRIQDWRLGELGDYLAFADAGLFAFAEGSRTRDADRRTLLQFAWSGVPAVANRPMQDAVAQELLTIAPEPARAVAAIEERLALRRDPAFRARCREAVRDRDWKSLLAPVADPLLAEKQP